MGKIAIVGAGMMGTALCWPLYDNKHTVHLIGTPLDEEIIRSLRKTRIHPKLEREIPAGIQTHFCAELSDVIAGADLVINGVSSFGTDWFTDAAGPWLHPDVPVLAVTKGLQGLPDGDLQPLTEYINNRLSAEFQKEVRFNAIAGPCIAHELAARRQTCVIFCGKELETLNLLKNIFKTPNYHIWTSTDVKEIEICAALKNGYALGVGIMIGLSEREGLDGLANMYNPQAAIFAQSCCEMRSLIRALGGKEEHVSWLPGAGDLFVTVYGGRTRKLGRLLGQGYSAREALASMSDSTLESVEIITRVAGALQRLERRKIIDQNKFPLLKFLDGVINKNEPIIFPWKDFYSPWGDGPFQAQSSD